MDYYLLVIAFFLIAAVYSSVGFGGGSSYLALLAVSGLEYHLIRSTALLCNVVVVAGGTYIFWKEHKFSIRQAWPFVVASVPLAYLGGRTPLREDTFFVILGATLILASAFLWIQQESAEANPPQKSRWLPFGIGGALGYLSGLISIGGGIFLSPILHFFRWADARTIAGLASFFILVNSVAGLAGQLQELPTAISWKYVGPLLLAVIAGGQTGSRLGARRLNVQLMKRVTAGLILLAAVVILRDHL